MDKQEIISEAKDRLRSLKDTSQRRREWYQDLNIKIADRQSTHIGLISSISAGILALTVSFSPQRSNIWIEISFWLLMATVFLGTILTLILIFFDKKVSNNDREIELSILDNLKSSTENVVQRPEQYEEHQNDFKNEIKKIQQLPEKYKAEKRFLNYLYIIFLFTFAGGILSLIGAWTAKQAINEFSLNSFVYIGLVLFLGLILGLIKFGTLETETWNWQRKFAEIWNDSLNFILAGLVGYYFVLIRWPRLLEDAPLQISDFALFIIFILGIFGHLCVLSVNITEGITAILKRVLEGK